MNVTIKMISHWEFLTDDEKYEAILELANMIPPKNWTNEDAKSWMVDYILKKRYLDSRDNIQCEKELQPVK